MQSARGPTFFALVVRNIVGRAPGPKAPTPQPTFLGSATVSVAQTELYRSPAPIDNDIFVAASIGTEGRVLQCEATGLEVRSVDRLEPLQRIRAQGEAKTRTVRRMHRGVRTYVEWR